MESLNYHDVVIQSSEQKCRIMCDLKMTLDGNLLPINGYKRLGGNMRESTRMVDRSVRLVTYNNAGIKQYGECYIMAQFRRTTIEAKFLLLTKQPH